MYLPMNSIVGGTIEGLILGSARLLPPVLRETKEKPDVRGRGCMRPPSKRKLVSEAYLTEDGGVIAIQCCWEFSQR